MKQIEHVEVVSSGEHGWLVESYETPRGKLRVRIALDSGRVVTFPLWSAKWIAR